METTEKSSGQMNVKKSDNLDFSKAEAEIKNIVIPNSQYSAKWVKGEGYAVGLENIKLTQSYDTLEEALNQIGYGVDTDEDGDEVLVKNGETDFEMILRIIKAVIIIENGKN